MPRFFARTPEDRLRKNFDLGNRSEVPPSSGALNSDPHLRRLMGFQLWAGGNPSYSGIPMRIPVSVYSNSFPIPCAAGLFGSLQGSVQFCPATLFVSVLFSSSGWMLCLSISMPGFLRLKMDSQATHRGSVPGRVNRVLSPSWQGTSLPEKKDKKQIILNFGA